MSVNDLYVDVAVNVPVYVYIFWCVCTCKMSLFKLLPLNNVPNTDHFSLFLCISHLGHLESLVVSHSTSNVGTLCPWP